MPVIPTVIQLYIYRHASLAVISLKCACKNESLLVSDDDVGHTVAKRDIF